jgi:hypothetical protein
VGRSLGHHLGVNESGLAHAGTGASLDAEEEDEDEDEEGEDGLDPAATEKSVSLRFASCDGTGKKRKEGRGKPEREGREEDEPERNERLGQPAVTPRNGTATGVTSKGSERGGADEGKEL